jgi:ABC transporter transmembrane region
MFILGVYGQSFPTKFSFLSLIRCDRVNWEETVRSTAAVFDGLLNWNTNTFIYIYASLIGALLYLTMHRSFAFYEMCLRISTNLHRKLFDGVIGAKMLFFNENSIGRIINRFSKDLAIVDGALPTVLVDSVIVSDGLVRGFKYSLTFYSI